MVMNLIILIACGIADVVCGVQILLQKHRMFAIAQAHGTIKEHHITYEMRILLKAIAGNAVVLSVLFLARSNMQLPAIYGSRLGISWVSIFGMMWGTKRFWNDIKLLRKG